MFRLLVSFSKKADKLKKILGFVIVLGFVFSFSSCSSSKVTHYSKNNAYRGFNSYASKKKFAKQYNHYYTGNKFNNRKRITPRFYQDRLCITFLRKKPKQPGNSVVKVYYPYEFVFLFFGKY